MCIYLNNCRARDYIGRYGDGAFYDFKTTGRQVDMARNLKKGQECIVATKVIDNKFKGKDEKIVFSRFSFLYEKIMPDETGRLLRVLFGKFVTSESFPKSEAAKKNPYSIFFNVNGDFKRISCISPKK